MFDPAEIDELLIGAVVERVEPNIGSGSLLIVLRLPDGRLLEAPSSLYRFAADALTN